MIAGCIRRGAGWAHSILNSSQNNVIYCGESGATFSTGDVIRTDYVAYVDGYPRHQNRNAVIGKPRADEESTYAKYRDVYLGTIEKQRPGLVVKDLFQDTVESFRRSGWEYQAGLIGHSVGPWWHQQAPMLTRTCETVLEEGMVLAIEPFVNYWHPQELMLLNGDGPEILSTHFDTSKLLVVG
jgi:methionine aminopeptidase